MYRKRRQEEIVIYFKPLPLQNEVHIMIGESALNLVKEAARNQGNLNPFNEDLVRQSIEETRRLWDQNR